MSLQSLTASSTPQQIAAAYKDYSTVAGNNVAVQDAARTMLLNKGIAAPTINQAFSLFSNPVALQPVAPPVVAPIAAPVAQKVVAPAVKTVSAPVALSQPATVAPKAPVVAAPVSTAPATGGVSDAFILSWLAKNPNPTASQISALSQFGVTPDRVKALSGAAPAPVAAPVAPTVVAPAAVTPTASNPFPGMTVEDLYRMHAGKEPDAEGLAFWKNAFGPEIDEAERAQFIKSVLEVQNKPAAAVVPPVTQGATASKPAEQPTKTQALTQLPESAQGKPVSEIIGDLNTIYKNVGATQKVAANNENEQTNVNSIDYGGGWMAWEKPGEVIGSTGQGETQELVYGQPTLGGFSHRVGDKMDHYDATGKFLYTTDAKGSVWDDLQPLVNMGLMAASFGALGPVAQLAGSGLNTAKAIKEGDWGTAIVGALGIAGAPVNALGLDKGTLETIKTAKTGAQVLNAVEKGDPIAIANALAATSTGQELLKTDIGGVTMGNVLDAAKVATALQNGNYAAAADYAGSLTGSSDLKIAGSSINLVKAIESGNPAAIASAIQRFEAATKSATKSSTNTGTQAGADVPLTEEETNQLVENRLNKAFEKYDLEAEQAAVDARTQEILDELAGIPPGSYDYDEFLRSIGIENPSDLGESPSNQDILDYIGYENPPQTGSDPNTVEVVGQRPVSPDEPDLGAVDVVGQRPNQDGEPDFGTIEVVGKRPEPEPDFGTIEVVGQRPKPEPDFGTIEVVGKKPEPDLGTIEVIGKRPDPEPDLGTIEVVAPRPEPVVPPVTPPPVVTPPAVKPPEVKPPVVTPPAVTPPKVTPQQIAQILGVPVSSPVVQDMIEALYGTMEYLDIDAAFSPAATRAQDQASTKQAQQTKMTEGGYLDNLLAENMSVDDLLNLLR